MLFKWVVERDRSVISAVLRLQVEQASEQRVSRKLISSLKLARKTTVMLLSEKFSKFVQIHNNVGIKPRAEIQAFPDNQAVLKCHNGGGFKNLSNVRITLLWHAAGPQHTASWTNRLALLVTATCWPAAKQKSDSLCWESCSKPSQGDNQWASDSTLAWYSWYSSALNLKKSSRTEPVRTLHLVLTVAWEKWWWKVPQAWTGGVCEPGLEIRATLNLKID